MNTVNVGQTVRHRSLGHVLTVTRVWENHYDPKLPPIVGVRVLEGEQEGETYHVSAFMLESVESGIGRGDPSHAE